MSCLTVDIIHFFSMMLPFYTLVVYVLKDWHPSQYKFKNTISSARGTLKKIVKQHCNIKYQYFLNIEPSLRKIVNFRGSDTNNFIFISCERLYRRWYNKRIAIFLLLTIFLNNQSLLLFPRGKINFHILWVKTFILGISVLLIWLCRLIGALALVER